MSERPQFKGRELTREQMDMLGITGYRDHGKVVHEGSGEIVFREEIWIGDTSLKSDVPVNLVALMTREDAARYRAKCMVDTVEVLRVMRGRATGDPKTLEIDARSKMPE